jgi:hypothetical protein
MSDSSIQPREGTLEDLRRMAAAGRLWAILDACDEPLVPPKVTELGPERAISLFRPPAEHEQWNVAPYLARVAEPLLAWIVQNLWPKPWGVFAICDEGDLHALRKHFRRFLIVQDPEGEAMYFRYYDPRILPVFLPSCQPGELKAFFGPLQGYAIGNPETEAVQLFLNVSK